MTSVRMPASALTLLQYRPQPGRLTLPDVCLDLLWADGRVYVTGPLSRAIEAIGVGREVSVLRLDPLVMRHWLDVPLNQFANRIIPLEEVARSLSDIVAAQFENCRVSAVVGAHLSLPQSLSYARGREAGARLRQGQRVHAVASAVGLSERQLERLFADLTGLTPRAYRRILRFRSAMLAAGRGAGLAGVASDCGYADQAHFSRDVHDLTGHSPRSLLRRVGNLQDIAAGTL